jgi:hypothetical protein
VHVKDGGVGIGGRPLCVVGMRVASQLHAVGVTMVAVDVGMDLARRNPAQHQAQHQHEPAQLPERAAGKPIETALEEADRHPTSMHESDRVLNPARGQAWWRGAYQGVDAPVSAFEVLLPMRVGNPAQKSC